MEWIKISDKLPETSDRSSDNRTIEEINPSYYLVIIEKNYHIFRYDSDMNFWFTDDYFYEYQDSDCYMLLPKL